jgi:hypothetical protein
MGNVVGSASARRRCARLGFLSRRLGSASRCVGPLLRGVGSVPRLHGAELRRLGAYPCGSRATFRCGFELGLTLR